MKDPDSVRREVSHAYARAVAREPAGSACCGGDPTPAGSLARLAGYTAEELRALPGDAAVHAFGCGNPVAFGGLAPGDVVLDLGSGAGIDLLLAAQKVGAGGRVIGVDMTPDMIDRARANIREAGLDNVEVREGKIEALPVEDASVDWVISNCVINLSPEKEKVFAQIARVLKPGGRMLVSDIVARDLPEWIRDDAELYCSCIAGAISEEAYLEGLRGAGLVDAEIRARQMYENAQLEALLESETGEGGSGSSCCGGSAGGVDRKRQAEGLNGRIWSAMIYARKPGP